MIAFFIWFNAISQYEEVVIHGSEMEQQIENLAAQQDGEPEDDSYFQTLEYYRRNKLNLNTAGESELKELRFVSDLQIQTFLLYRKVLGNLISIYELQAVPGWDLTIIQKLLLYVKVGNVLSFSSNLKDRLTSGQHSLLLRMQQVLEKSNGFNRPDSISIRYPGSATKIMFRYKYNYRNIFQFGVTGDKDAGEMFFRGSQKQGFDFYSFHLFARKLGVVKHLALGDFTVNLGQGLIHWQSMAFKKSADITAVKRQADILRPYNSPGEYNFMRGVGITVGVKHFDFTTFASLRKIDGTVNADTSQTNDDYISSILNSGYHRTITEVSKKNAITQTAIGGNVSYRQNSLHVGVNAVAFKFSAPLIRNNFLYNTYAIRGDRWVNYSFDYSYTYRNVHFFGEAAIDKHHSRAFVGGLLASLNEKVDASLVYRNIEKSYQTLYGNAFTESAYPTNEKGLFTGLSLRPTPLLKIDAYADVFSFPWLRYRVDAPSKGSEYLLQLSFRPNRQIEFYTRLKNESKEINRSGLDVATHFADVRPRQSWRTQIVYKISRQITYSQRLELLWFDHNRANASEQGYLMYVDCKYKPLSQPMSLQGRLQFFQTKGFDSRIYAFENDVLYSFSIPQFIGKGFRYYLNFKSDISKKMIIWFRWAQTIYGNQNSISSGLDQIIGNKRSEIKVQFLYSF
ncbi:MAG: hypothetical protein JWR18_97 [Segetibacter sp.]|nr:hypothetical protein [Segetibacter sp.]